ncbi:hypothetical protein evm_010079 [Chilo suppressalis]|nr:hypothetical protein evm_010079 [Chilo suppressalis]
MSMFSVAMLLCILSLYSAECHPLERNEEVKAGILSLCGQFRTTKFLCLLCKGFDPSCFFSPTSSTSTSTTSSSTTTTPSTTTPTTTTTTTAAPEQ